MAFPVNSPVRNRHYGSKYVFSAGSFDLEAIVEHLKSDDFPGEFHIEIGSGFYLQSGGHLHAGGQVIHIWVYFSDSDAAALFRLHYG